MQAEETLLTAGKMADDKALSNWSPWVASACRITANAAAVAAFFRRRILPHVLPMLLDSRPKLKDLAFLKDQLEHLQRRVENEVQAGVGKEGSFLTSPFFKGFLAGYVVAKLRSSAVLGFFVGACTGVYAAQTYAVPNVEKTIKDCFSSLRKGPD